MLQPAIWEITEGDYHSMQVLLFRRHTFGHCSVQDAVLVGTLVSAQYATSYTGISFLEELCIFEELYISDVRTALSSITEQQAAWLWISWITEVPIHITAVVLVCVSLDKQGHDIIFMEFS